MRVTTTNLHPPARRQWRTGSQGLISLEPGMVRVDSPYRADNVVLLRELCWRYGGGFRRDASGAYWLIGLAGIRAVRQVFPALVITSAARRAVAEQAWCA